MNSRQSLVMGSIMMMLAVGIGAFGAHALKDLLTENGYLATFETGSKYHFYHALGLIVIGILQKQFPNLGGLGKASIAMLLGILVFSGSLYILSITGIKWLGAITPFGGVGFILAWGIIAWSLYRNGTQS